MSSVLAHQRVPGSGCLTFGCCRRSFITTSEKCCCRCQLLPIQGRQSCLYLLSRHTVHAQGLRAHSCGLAPLVRTHTAACTENDLQDTNKYWYYFNCKLSSRGSLHIDAMQRVFVGIGRLDSFNVARHSVFGCLYLHSARLFTKVRKGMLW